MNFKKAVPEYVVSFYNRNSSIFWCPFSNSAGGELFRFL